MSPPGKRKARSALPAPAGPFRTETGTATKPPHLDSEATAPVNRCGKPREAEDLVTAWHETGHAVAYLSHRCRFRYVTIRPRDGSLGRLVKRPAKSWSGHVLIRSYAGPIAEACYLLGGPPASLPPMLLDFEYDEWEEDDDDRSAAFRLRRQLGITDHPDIFQNLALALVTDHWSTIGVIAEALCEQKTLSYSEVQQLAASHSMPWVVAA